MQHETKPSQSGADSAATADHATGSPVETADPTSETTQIPAEAELVPSFLHEIARTMQAAVDRERGRIVAAAANTLEAHVEQVRRRAAAEAAELKRLAEEDVDHIRAWSAAEAERIGRETENRIGARRENLDRHLRQHDALVEREIAGASVAVEEYRVELDRFVATVAEEQEPTEIARLAKQLPEPPRVEEIASAARADAIAELSRSEASADGASKKPDVVGVMGPRPVSQAVGAKAKESEPAQTAGATPQESAPAPTADVTTEAEQPAQARLPRILGAQNRADLILRLALIVILAVLITTALLVMTGQARAGILSG